MSKKLTKEEFIKRAEVVHSGKFNYDNMVYTAMLTKATMTCPDHGDWEQKPADHLGGHGCPKCKGEKSSCKWGDVRQQFSNVHGDYYSYDDSSYTRNGNKMKIFCPEHGEFWQKPELHKKGAGCKLCTASGGPGKYCESIFSKKPELKSASGILYLLELNDSDGTKFFKVGITVNMRTRYYDFIKKNGGKICWTQNYSLYDCFKKEQKILEENKDFKYVPKMSLAGKTECLTKEVFL